MSKLEELGGLEALKKMIYSRTVGYEIASIGGHTPIDWIVALIEHIESLTAERDQLKKRVEELERQNEEETRKYRISHSRRLERNEELTKKLQAARELAEMVYYNHDSSNYLGNKASDFLKMLDSQAPESTPTDAT